MVTGAGGFLGGVLAWRLANVGHRVVALDRDLSRLPRHALIERWEADVRDWRDDGGEPFDHVYHLACIASPPRYLREPIDTLTTNADGMLRALEYAANTGARVLFTSTSEVYGDPTEHPQREAYWGNVNPIGVRSCYDEGKRYAEALCLAFRRERGVDVRIARIFNTYGPTMRPDDGRVVSSFVLAALRGEPLPVHGDGSQTRSLCYVDDTIAGLVALMESDADGLIGQPVNIGNPHEITILDLANRINDATGNAAGVVFRDAMKDDPTRRCPVIERARSSLLWSPSVPLSVGLSRVIEAYARDHAP